MAKKHKKAGGRGKAPTLQPEFPPPPRRGILRRVGAFLSPTGMFWASVSLVAAFVGLYFLLRPQILVEPDVSLDPSNPNATLFRVTNQGVLPIYDVTRDLNVLSMSDPARGISLSGSKMVNWPPGVKTLSSGESTDITLPTYISPLGPNRAAMNIRYTQCDISIDCGYKDVLGFSHRKLVGFQCIVGTDKLAHWYHKEVVK